MALGGEVRNPAAGGSGADEKVGVDSGATAGYLGAASNDGVLRTVSPLSYTDGGDFVTLGISADGINDTHIDWGVGANQVSAVDVPIADSGTIITATEVEGALQENRTAIDLNTTHSAGDGSDHADVATNTAHSTGDGSDHSDVALNTTHRTSDGTDHTYINQDVTTTGTPTFGGLTDTSLVNDDHFIYSDAGTIKTYYTLKIADSGNVRLVGSAGMRFGDDNNTAVWNTGSALKILDTVKVIIDTPNLELDDGVLTSATGTVDFDDDNITTTGDVTGANLNVSNWDDAHTHITSDGSDHTYINQSVTTLSSPTFSNLTLTGGATINNQCEVSNYVTVAGNYGFKIEDGAGNRRAMLFSSGTYVYQYVDESGFYEINMTAGAGSSLRVNADGSIQFGAYGAGLLTTDASGDITTTTNNTSNWDDAYTHVSSNGSDHSYIDQNVTSGSSPTFDGTNFTGIPGSALDDTYVDVDGTVDLTADWTITHSIIIDSDTEGITLGDDQDCDITWDNTNGVADISTGVSIGGTSPSEFNTEVIANKCVTRKGFFSAYHSGGTTVGTSATDITWNTEIRKDADYYSHGSGSAQITIEDDGWYMIMVDVGAENSSATRHNCQWNIQINTGGGFGDMSNTKCGTYHRLSGTDGYQSTNIIRLVELNADDIIKVVGVSDSSSDISTLANYCRITIQRV